ATIVIAYLMKKQSIGYKEAFKIVQEKRPKIHPNRGFVEQLKLWQEMDYQLDFSHPLYRKIVLVNCVMRMREELAMKDGLSWNNSIGSKSIRDYYCKSDGKFHQMNSNPKYLCSHCSNEIF